MHPRYSAHFRIEPGTDPAALANEVFAGAEDWVEGVIDRGPIRLPVEGGSIEPAPGCRASIRLADDRGGWTLTFRREEGGAPVESRLRVKVADTGVELAFLDSGEREPNWRYIRPPEFLGELIEKHECRVGSIGLSPEPTALEAQAVEDFVEELLFAPDRSLPFVVISQDEYLGKPLVDPEEITARLAGLARVFVLDDRSASWALTRTLGNKELGCYMGAVRLYLPGFTLEGNPREHLLLLGNGLASKRGRSAAELLLAEAMSRFPAWYKNGGLLGELVGQVALRPARVGAEPLPERRPTSVASVSHIGAATQPSGPPARVVQRVVERQALPEQGERPATAMGLLPMMKELVAQNDYLLARNEELEQGILDAEEERQLFSDEIDEVKARYAALAEKRDELEDLLEKALAELGPLRFRMDKIEAEHPELFEEPPETVLDALNRVAELDDPALLFLPSAYASAGDSPYRDPAKVLAALQALSEVAGKRRKAAEAGVGLGAWPVQLFESRGIHYASHQTTNTKARWSTEYRITYDGKRVDLDEHLTLGTSRDPAACLRIYFFWDPTRRATVVAHVGRHKRNTLT